MSDIVTATAPHTWLVRSAFLAVTPRPELEAAVRRAGFTGSPIMVPAGILAADLNNSPGDEHMISLVMPLVVSGQIVAALAEWSDRNGLSHAHAAAIDQGRAYARSMPGR